MSRLIAPGKWDPIDRQVARLAGTVAGLGLLWVAYKFGVPLVEGVKAGKDITLWSALLVLVPLALGSAAVFPNVIPPLIVRAIEKIGRDSPPSGGA